MKKKPSKFLIMSLLTLFGTISSAFIVNSFANFGAKARQAEAKSNLAHIHILQQTYFLETGRYASISSKCGESNAIGFIVPSCEAARYEFWTEKIDKNVFVAVARERVVDGERKVFKGCTGPLDEWQIDETKVLTSRIDMEKSCPVIENSLPIPPMSSFLGGFLSQIVFTLLIFTVEFLLLIFPLHLRLAASTGLRLAIVTVPTLLIFVVLVRLVFSGEVSILPVVAVSIFAICTLVFLRRFSISSLDLTQIQSNWISVLPPLFIGLVAAVLMFV